jgi:hypothetical protein
MGPPIRTHIPFSLAHRLKTANEEAVAREDAGEVSEDDGSFEGDNPDPTTERPCTPPSQPYGPLLSLSPLDELTDSESDEPGAQNGLDPPPSHTIPPPTPQALPGTSSERPSDRPTNLNAKKVNFKMRRAKKREILRQGRNIKGVALVRRGQMTHTQANFDTASSRIASTAWQGHRESADANEKVTYSLEELLALPDHHFRVEKWDGLYVCFFTPASHGALTPICPSQPRAIADSEDRVTVMLAGQPRDQNWSGVYQSASDDLRDAGPQCDFAEDDLDHRRGAFPALRAGVSFGGGQKVSKPRPGG